LGRGIAAIIDEDRDSGRIAQRGFDCFEAGGEIADQRLAPLGHAENGGYGADLVEELGEAEGAQIAAFDIEAGLHAQIVQLVSGVAGFAEAIGIAGIDEIGLGIDQLFSGGDQRRKDGNAGIGVGIGRADGEIGHVGRAGHLLFETQGQHQFGGIVGERHGALWRRIIDCGDAAIVVGDGETLPQCGRCQRQGAKGQKTGQPDGTGKTMHDQETASG
jgi:hypothetical protein